MGLGVWRGTGSLGDDMAMLGGPQGQGGGGWVQWSGGTGLGAVDTGAGPAAHLVISDSEGAELRPLDAQIQRSEDMLQRLRAVVPQMDMEGDRNIWIVKPGAKSRGRGEGWP